MNNETTVASDTLSRTNNSKKYSHNDKINYIPYETHLLAIKY